MRNLGEIIDNLRDGGTAEYDELRYAVIALDSLITFDRLAFSNLATGKRENKNQILVYDPEFQYEKHFDRVRNAIGKSPKEYIGWNNDPDNPEFLKRRTTAKKITGKFFGT